MPRTAIAGSEDHCQAIASHLDNILKLAIDNSTASPQTMSRFNNPAPPAAVLNSKVGFCSLVDRSASFRTIDV
jgi:hypothetical protein